MRSHEGELIVRGPNVMLGYHNKPEETAKALRNGWYHTGDLARADRNGFVTITGRLKELIIRGGQNIAPAEIEEVVLLFSTVLDCAVAGVAPSATRRGARALYVVPRDGSFDADLLLDHCRHHLSSYKVPHVVHQVDEIPRTGSGKIIRFRLKEMVQSLALTRLHRRLPVERRAPDPSGFGARSASADRSAGACFKGDAEASCSLH